MLLPQPPSAAARAYVDRRNGRMAVAKFEARAGWRAIERPIFIRRPVPGAHCLVRSMMGGPFPSR